MRNAKVTDRALLPSEYPSEAETIFLGRRAAELSACLVGTSPGLVEKLVLPLLVTMKSKAAGEADAGYIRRIYAEVLSPQPHFALARACREFLTLVVGGGWRPDPGEIFQRAELHARPYRDELAEIRDVLEFARGRRAGPGPDSGRVASLIREDATAMKASGSSKKREFSAPLAADVEAELAAKYRDKPRQPLSEEMRVILGRGIPEK